MATPSSLGAAGDNAVIPLVSTITPEQLKEKVTLTRTVGVNGDKRKTTCLYLTDDMQPKLVIRHLRDFETSIPNARLQLNNGALRFEYFSKTLGGSALDIWDTIAQAQPGTTMNDWNTAIAAFIRRVVKPTDLAGQTKYLDNAKKPFKLTMPQLSDRLRFTNNLMAKFPGANGNPPYNEQELKLKLFAMCLEPWRNSFATSGNDISDPNYTYDMLTNYMAVQETAYNARLACASRTPNRGRGVSRGRGRGRGGRFAGQHRPLEYQGGGDPQRQRVAYVGGRGSSGNYSGGFMRPSYPQQFASSPARGGRGGYYYPPSSGGRGYRGGGFARGFGRGQRSWPRSWRSCYVVLSAATAADATA